LISSSTGELTKPAVLLSLDGSKYCMWFE
jgi:hypothetical protein